MKTLIICLTALSLLCFSFVSESDVKPHIIFNGIMFGESTYQITLEHSPSINEIKSNHEDYELYSFKATVYDENEENGEISREHYKKNKIDSDFFNKIQSFDSKDIVIQAINLKHKGTGEMLPVGAIQIKW